jgi:putative transposase
MSKQKRHWKVQEKLEILEYYKQNGLGRTVRKYQVSQTTLYKWRDKFEAEGPSGLESKGKKIDQRDPELLRLERENKELKAIVAEKELQLRIQAEMLKKSH